MADPPPLPTYDAASFDAPDKVCDLVMKGGVTSGVVYPYAILELARVYRFKSIGGTSAGAIAAAFAAAAEYARTVRHDPGGFTRLQTHCDQLPDILGSLFQPSPAFKPLMRWLLRAQARPGASGWLLNAPLAFWGTALLGAGLGGLLLWALDGGVAGILLGALVGLLVALVLRMSRLILRGLPRHGFGMCTGLSQPGHDTPALTDWLHAALQDIAFGDPAHLRPLTFGDLIGPDPDRPIIDLRMITTNLSMRRPHTLPRLELPAGFRRDAWSRLFPAPVMTHLDRVCGEARRLKGLQAFPAAQDLPVLIGVRMSLSFPILFAAVPMVVRDVHGAVLSRKTGGDGKVRPREVWFTDGGLSSNFPIHLFDALLPAHPTFALSLDELPAGADPDGERVSIPSSAGDGVNLPVHAVPSVGAFASGILGAAKDWQDQMLASMPGQRERIARVLLSKEEGGLNLTMPSERSLRLMGYGREVGRRFAQGDLNFDEHRWRRGLVAYEQIERTVGSTARTWTEAGFGAWLETYMANPKSYNRVTKTDRGAIHRRLGAFAELRTRFDPAIKGGDRKFPNPAGRWRIGPDV